MENSTAYSALLKKMQETYLGLTGASPDDASDVGIRFKVLAKETAELMGQLEEIGRQAFPQTATGRALELHGEQRGIKRKQGTPAKGTAVFLRSVAADREIISPAGTAVATGGSPGARFITTEAAVMALGATEAQVPVVCTVPGPQGNCGAGALQAMVTPVPGIQAVTNRQPLTGGAPQEDDEALRARLLDTYLNISNGTNSAFYRGVASAYEEVSSVHVIPRARGTGTVDVIVWGEGVDSAFLEKLGARFQEIKEINVDISVEQAQARPVAVTLEVLVTENISWEEAQEACRRKAEAFFRNLPVAQPLLLAHLGKALMEGTGVHNYRIAAPQEDVWPTRRQKITLGELKINPMEERGGNYDQ